MNDLQLASLSLSELRQLNDDIEVAIRAAIRERTAQKSPMAKPVTRVVDPVDLERERDAWIAARRSSKSVSMT